MTAARRVLVAVSPWSGAETVRLLGTCTIGLLAVVVAWWAAANQAALADQVSWLSLATLGFAVASWSSVRWLLRGRVAIGDRMTRLLPVAVFDLAAVEQAPARAITLGRAPARVHRPDCRLVAGKGWPVVAVDDPAAAGRERCGVCRP